MIDDFESVSITNVTVNAMDLPTEVAGGMTKQDILITDEKGSASLTLWEEDVGKFEEGVSYSLNDVLVRSFRELSFSRGASMTVLGTVGEADEDSNMEDCKIIGVDMTMHYTCLSCKQQKVIVKKYNLGCCTNCNIKQLLNCCKVYMTAKLVIINENMQKSLLHLDNC